MTTTAEVEKMIADAATKYAFVGLRTIDGDRSPLDHSHVWIDGDCTSEMLDGISATDALDATALAQHSLAPRNWSVGYYFGDHVYVVAGHRAECGNDRGEIIIRDAVLIGGGKRA